MRVFGVQLGRREVRLDLLRVAVIALVGSVAVVLVVGGVRFASAADFHGSITVGGSAVTVTMSTSGDNGYVTFSGTAGEQMGLGLTGVTSGMTNWNAKILNPDSSTLTSALGIGVQGWDMNFTLPSTGTYTVLIDPQGSTTGSVTLTLSDDLAASITTGGSAVTATISRYGQNERVTFGGAAGEQMGLGLTGVTSGMTNWNASVLNPDGSTLTSALGIGVQGAEMNFTLPSTGTYTVFIDPKVVSGGLIATGSATLTLSDDLAASITAGGSAVTATISRYGQNEGVTFAGTVGEQMGLGLTGVTSGMTNWNAKVLNPDGSTLTSALGIGVQAWDMNFTLPSTGTYTVFIDPKVVSGGLIATGSVTLTLSDDLTGTLTNDGADRVTSILRAGQNARIAFAGASSQQLALWILNVTSGMTQYKVSILNPDGSTLDSLSGLGTSGWQFNETLPTTGTYSIFIDPTAVSTGSVTLRLRPRGDAPADTAVIAACGTTPVFRAEPASGSSLQYQFQVATDSGFSSVVSDSGALPATNTYTPAAGALTNGQGYYWRWKTVGGSWSGGRSLSISQSYLGAGGSAPIWSDGSLAVNEATGNLLVSLPGPGFPTAIGSLAASLSYNSLDATNRGFGAGWLLDAGASGGERAAAAGRPQPADRHRPVGRGRGVLPRRQLELFLPGRPDQHVYRRSRRRNAAREKPGRQLDLHGRRHGRELRCRRRDHRGRATLERRGGERHIGKRQADLHLLKL